jgi:hypothetical protein
MQSVAWHVMKSMSVCTAGVMGGRKPPKRKEKKGKKKKIQ